MSAPAIAADILHRLLTGFGPDVTVEERAGTRRYLRGERVFAVLRVLKTRVDVGFSRMGRARSTRILHARTGGLPFVRHRVIVEAPGDVDTELRAWLREGYELLDPTSPKS